MSLRVGRSSGARWSCDPGPPVSMSHGPAAGWRHCALVPATATRRVLSGRLQSKHVQSPWQWLGSHSNHPLYRLLKPTVQSVSPNFPPAPAPGPGHPRDTPGPPSTLHQHPQLQADNRSSGARTGCGKKEPWGLMNELQSTSVNHTFRVGGLALRLMVLPFS